MSISEDGQFMKFVDFQYIGRGPPSKDLAYFFVCGMDCEDDFEQCREKDLVEFYINELASSGVDASLLPSFDELMKSLDIAYCDLYRWMCGWGVWGNSFLPNRVERCLDEVVQSISLET